MENISILEGEVIAVVRRAVDLVRDTGFSVSEKGDVTDIVTSNDILSQNFLIEELGKLIGTTVDKRKINMKDSIKAYGKFDVEIKVHPEVVAKFFVLVHELKRFLYYIGV